MIRIMVFLGLHQVPPPFLETAISCTLNPTPIYPLVTIFIRMPGSGGNPIPSIHLSVLGRRRAGHHLQKQGLGFRQHEYFLVVEPS